MTDPQVAVDIGVIVIAAGALTVTWTGVSLLARAARRIRRAHPVWWARWWAARRLGATPAPGPGPGDGGPLTGDEWLELDRLARGGAMETI